MSVHESQRGRHCSVRGERAHRPYGVRGQVGEVGALSAYGRSVSCDVAKPRAGLFGTTGGWDSGSGSNGNVTGKGLVLREQWTGGLHIDGPALLALRSLAAGSARHLQRSVPSARSGRNA